MLKVVLKKVGVSIITEEALRDMGKNFYNKKASFLFKAYFFYNFVRMS